MAGFRFATCPRLVCEQGGSAQLGSLASELGLRHAFVVTDRFLHDQGLLGPALTSLEQAGIAARVVTQLAPAWTTDWMSDEAKEKLRAYGIAPPHQTRKDVSVVKFMRRPAAEAVACPQCGSTHTVVTSEFGSTACKALYKCLDCQEPFDYFKPY